MLSESHVGRSTAKPLPLAINAAAAWVTGNQAQRLAPNAQSLNRQSRSVDALGLPAIALPQPPQQRPHQHHQLGRGDRDRPIQWRMAG